MPRPPFPANVRQFQRQFATEEACQQYLAACRWPDGFRCPRCRHERAYVMVNHRRWKCVACRYETAWMMLHKLRRAMVNAAREPLHGEVEVDDTWIGGPQPGIKGSRQLKDRRAGPVLVAVERRDARSGRIRMVVLPNFTAMTMVPVQGAHRPRFDGLP